MMADPAHAQGEDEPLSLSAGDRQNDTLKAEDALDAPKVAGSSLGAWALPGLVSMPLPVGLRAGDFALAAHGSYGLTEPLPGDTGGHQRLAGEIALAHAPTKHLALALRLDGRIDLHPDDALGADKSYNGLPRLAVRYGRPTGNWLWGTELSAWFPGRQAPSIALEAASADVRGLLSYRTHNSILLASTFGYRFDRSGAIRPDLARLRPGDRSALGLSDYDAILAGLGCAIRRERWEWLADVGIDLFVGDRAPGLPYSPVHIGAGWRRDTGRHWQLSALGRFDLVRRPGLANSEPLIPIEPRILFSFGIAYRPAAARIEQPNYEPRGTNDIRARTTVAEKLEPSRASAASGLTLTVRIAPTRAGTPTASATTTAARLELQAADGSTLRAETGPDGTATFADVPPGRGRLRVEAAGFETIETTVSIGGDSPRELALQLAPAKPRGQLRGLVRSYRGTGLRATVSIDPLAIEVQTESDGTFKVDVPPGRYRVNVRARGFDEQQRSIRVEEDGVTILNADLHRK